MIFVDLKQAPEPEDILWTNLGQNRLDLYSKRLVAVGLTVILLGICFFAVLYIQSYYYHKK